MSPTGAGEIVFRDVRVFDGQSGQLSEATDVTVVGIKQAIDQGLVPGPRIWPSGAMISQTSGHADFRFPYETPRGTCGWLSRSELVGAAAIADGVPEVLRAVREQLRGGASQIK